MCAPHVVVIVLSDHHIMPGVNAYSSPIAAENEVASSGPLILHAY